MAIVLFSALVVAVESVLVEWAINTAQIRAFAVSAVPSLVGGVILIAAIPRESVAAVRSFDRRSWRLMGVAVALISAGVLLWFDAVGKIGAGKEAILGGGSSEILFIVILGAIVLSERLARIELIGSVMVVAGVLLVLVNSEELTWSVGEGEAEAIVSSLLLAASVIVTTILLRSHPLAAISGLELLLSGFVLLAVGIVLGYITWIDVHKILILVSLGVLPALGIVTYNAGLPKIGASLTSVLFALTGIMTVGVQLFVSAAYPEIDMKLPQSVPLAVLGGLIAFAGIYFLSLRHEKPGDPA